MKVSWTIYFDIDCFTTTGPNTHNFYYEIFDSGSKRKLTDTEAINKNGPTANGVIIIAGDAFTESNFEGCLRSAKAAAAAIGLHYIQ